MTSTSPPSDPSDSAAGNGFAITDYGFVSDCSSASLVNREGSIDWWCLLRFDSPATFARPSPGEADLIRRHSRGCINDGRGCRPRSSLRPSGPPSIGSHPSNSRRMSSPRTGVVDKKSAGQEAHRGRGAREGVRPETPIGRLVRAAGLRGGNSVSHMHAPPLIVQRAAVMKFISASARMQAIHAPSQRLLTPHRPRWPRASWNRT
jgi:hypothetical protein